MGFFAHICTYIWCSVFVLQGERPTRLHIPLFYIFLCHQNVHISYRWSPSEAHIFDCLFGFNSLTSLLFLGHLDECPNPSPCLLVHPITGCLAMIYILCLSRVIWQHPILEDLSCCLCCIDLCATILGLVNLCARYDHISRGMILTVRNIGTSMP